MTFGGAGNDFILGAKVNLRDDRQRRRRLDRDRHPGRRARRQFRPASGRRRARQRRLRRRRRLRRDDRRRRRRHLRRQRRPGQDRRHVRLRLGDLQERHASASPSTCSSATSVEHRPMRGISWRVRNRRSIYDRFAEVEGLSGSAFADFLRGDEQDAAIIANVTARGSVLTNFDLVSGLQAFVGSAGFGADGIGARPTISSAPATSSSAATAATSSKAAAATTSSTATSGSTCASACVQNVDGTGPEIASFDSMAPMIPLHAGRHLQSRPARGRARDPAGRGRLRHRRFPGPWRTTRSPSTITAPPLNFADDIVTVTDNVGTRRHRSLTNIERLQFADQSVVLVPGLNAEPVGALTIDQRHAPTVGQTADRVDRPASPMPTTRAGRSPVPISYIWQFEATPGSGVFEDIILGPGRIGIGFASADGTTFTVTPDLDGLRAARQGHLSGRPRRDSRQVFSAPTAAVSPRRRPPRRRRADRSADHVASPATACTSSAPTCDSSSTRSRSRKRHAAGAEPAYRSAAEHRACRSACARSMARYNNLVQGQTEFGAADNVFPRC